MTSPRILVVDDEADLRELLEITLLKMGLDVDSAASLTEARAFLDAAEYALVLTDMRLPDGMGIELVVEVASRFRNTPVAVITAFGSADNAVAALKAGAFDYLAKPVALDQLRSMVQAALRINLTQQSRRGESADEPGAPLRLIGQSAVMKDVRSQIVRLARSMAPVAITGESGSGKELAARDIHSQSARADKPFVAVNCGAIPESLMEAEFFGYRKGAFTGANSDREGFFQAAHGGTMMLDEVADLPLAMQVKLLRVIQERRVRRLGGTVEEPVDVRLISATHQNLGECVEAGRFRQDLFYRLNVIELRLPALRERLDDVGILSGAILSRLATPGHNATLSAPALAALQAYRFPGNVRELENILERALAFSNDGKIELADLALKACALEVAPAAQQPSPPAAAQNYASYSQDEAGSFARPVQQPNMQPIMQPAMQPAMQPSMHAFTPSGAGDLPASLPDHLDQVERDIIRRALNKTHFNRTQAAELLGISFRQLRYRMQRLDIQAPD